MDTLERRPHRRGSLRAEIELSWRRAKLGGLRPDAPVDRLGVSDVDYSSRLMAAAGPVLQEMKEELSGTRYSLLLADEACRIVERWFDTPAIERALEDISAVPGSQFVEDAIGTNGLGTPMETRAGVVVHGEEHFHNALKRFSCYGHPIRHPLTHRIEGVLDITGITRDANPMLAPFLGRAVRDIERRLLEGARVSDRLLHESFQRAAQRRSRPVAALGQDTVLANKAAIDLLEAGDHSTLRALAEGPCPRESWSRQVRLVSGALVDIQAQRIPGTTGGTLFHIDPVVRPHPPIPRGSLDRRKPTAATDLGALRNAIGPVLITGEPGTGRTTAVHAVTQAREVEFLSAADVAAMGEQTWAQRLTKALGRPTQVLAVEDLHLLPGPLCALVARTVSERPAAPLVVTSAPVDQLSPLSASVAAGCVARAELPPLRNRIDEFPELVRAMLAELCPDGGVRLTPSALEALAAQPWPGNLRELHGVLHRLTARRSAGDITLADLPTAYRGGPQVSRLAGRERAERGAIIGALGQTRGNKVRAAELLGISRTTLYSRMKALGVASVIVAAESSST